MASLAQFREKIIVAEKPIKKDGYRMDGKDPNNMRRHAGLGDGNCCDYLIKNEGSFVLIEETQLWKTIKRYKERYFDLSENTLHNLTIRLIRDETRLKVFFALLVLCRLAAAHPEFKKIAQAKKCHIWLVASTSSTEMIFLENLEKGMRKDVGESLLGALGGSIGKEMERFQVVPGEKLESKISEYAPTY